MARTITVESMLDQYGAQTYIGVLETCCFPASFYAYFVRPDGHGGYDTTDHATCYYHRTIADAQAAFDKLVPHYKKVFAKKAVL